MRQGGSGGRASSSVRVPASKGVRGIACAASSATMTRARAVRREIDSRHALTGLVDEHRYVLHVTLVGSDVDGGHALRAVVRVQEHVLDDDRVVRAVVVHVRVHGHVIERGAVVARVRRVSDLDHQIVRRAATRRRGHRGLGDGLYIFRREFSVVGVHHVVVCADVDADAVVVSSTH